MRIALFAPLLLLGCGAGRGAVSRPRVWPLRADSIQANGGERDCDLVHLELDLRLDYDSHRVSGTATSWVRGLAGGTTEVRLHAVGLEIHEVRDGRGRELEYRREEGLLTVLLPERLAEGEELALRVTYTAVDPEKGMVFIDADPSETGFAPEIWTQGQFEDNRYWMPVWDLPNDRATVDLAVRAPLDMSVVGPGELTGVEEHGGGERTFRWRLAQRIPTYLVAFAAGRWETYVDHAGELPLAYHVPPGTGEEAARAAFHETPAMLTFFEELLDEPFPFAKYDQAVVAGFPWAGMEDASITILYDEILGGADALLDLDGDPRLLVAHELAHQWFGDLVTCLGWSHLWLNEAWASYLELVWEGEVAGQGSRALWLERYAERFLARGDACRIPIALDWYTQGMSDQRANHVYTKGPWVLHMLERRLGEEPFWAATRAYLDRYRDGLVTTGDFARVIFDTTGRNVEGFFEQWVLLGGYPVIDVQLVSGKDSQGRDWVDIVLRQTQEIGPTVPLFDLSVVLELVTAEGKERREVHLFEGEVKTRVRTSELRDVIVDPDGDLLARFEIEKPPQMWMRQAGRSDLPVAQWRSLGEVARSAHEGVLAAASALMRVAGESPEPLLRERAAASLDLDDPRAARTLLRLLALDPAARVRRQAAETLLTLTRAGRELDGEELTLLQQRLGIERSPATRALLEALVESTR